MARANRLSGHGGIFHVTHRCHNREFLLKFALDRQAYRAKLRERLPEFNVALLDYCITSNHVHLLLDAEERMQISGLMRTVAGEFARAYNRRKNRMNAEQFKREPCWTEGLAVGSAGFLERIRPLILSRQETELVQHDRNFIGLGW